MEDVTDQLQDDEKPERNSDIYQATHALNLQ
jgi:hypothetical protein